MAQDIFNAISGVTTEIHNGSSVVGPIGRGSLTRVVDIYSSRAVLIPSIITIDDKFSGRIAYWKRYYTGDTDD